MNLVLLAIALASMAAALGLGWYAWRLREEERRRSDARVAALSSAIYDDPRIAGGAGTAPPVPNSLFAPEHSAAAKGSPAIRLAVGAAMVLVLIGAIAMRGGSDAASESGEAATRVRTRAIAPLELLSMRHEREGDALRVSGLVRNPRGGTPVRRVTAVVLVFNRAGAFVARGQAGLDFTTLDAGDESPFVVSIPGVSDVARYRVSFRTDAGVIQHVDRRADQLGLAARLE